MAETIVIRAASADTIADETGEIVYTADIENKLADDIPIILALDIYPFIKPSDPRRHLGWWNTNLTLKPGVTRVEMKRRGAEAEIKADGISKPADDSWRGGFKEDGLYDVSFVIYGTSSGKPEAIAKTVRKQVLIFSGLRADTAAERYWPERNRRTPPLSMPDYITLTSLAAMVKDFAESHCPSHSALLDVGCGSKPYLPFFIGREAIYIGLDLTPTEFADVVASSEILPFSDNSFDAVMSTQVFEHIPEPALTAKEIYRVLKPGGYALISLPFAWEEHDFPYDYWRYAPAGAKRLFGDFTLVNLRPNGTTYQSIMQLKNLYWHKNYRRDHLSFEKKFIFRVRNLWAALAGKMTKDISLSPNFTLLLRKEEGGPSASGKSFIDDFVRVYPGAVVYDENGKLRESTENDLKIFVNHRKIYEFVSQFVEGKKIVDLGCGSGYGSALLKESGAASVAGCDLSQHAISFAREHYGKIADFTAQAVDDLALYEDGFFDVSVSCEVLEHLKEQGLEKSAIREMKRITRPGGLIFVGTPNTEMIEEHGFSFKEIRDLLADNFSEFVIFENALVPFGDAKRLWEERLSSGQTGVIISEDIDSSLIVSPEGFEPSIKQGMAAGEYQISGFTIDTTRLHNTHSWSILAINN